MPAPGRPVLSVAREWHQGGFAFPVWDGWDAATALDDRFLPLPVRTISSGVSDLHVRLKPEPCHISERMASSLTENDVYGLFTGSLQPVGPAQPEPLPWLSSLTVWPFGQYGSECCSVPWHCIPKLSTVC